MPEILKKLKKEWPHNKRKIRIKKIKIVLTTGRLISKLISLKPDSYHTKCSLTLQ